MLYGDSFETHQVTIGDVIVAVMDAAMEVTEDEEMAREIASRVLVNILEEASPGAARDLIAAMSNGLQ